MHRKLRHTKEARDLRRGRTTDEEEEEEEDNRWRAITEKADSGHAEQVESKEILLDLGLKSNCILDDQKSFLCIYQVEEINPCRKPFKPSTNKYWN